MVSVNIKTILKKYWIYFGLIVITLTVGELYPFSSYPMYNNFPNWSYTFYYKDQNNKDLIETMKISHGGLSHLYYSECQKQGVEYGNGIESKSDLEIVGSNITIKAFDLSALDSSTTKLRLYRIYNFVESEKVISNISLISELDVK